MQAANRVIKNTLILYVRTGITMFVSLYATRLILAALGTEDFGIFNVVGGAIAMLTFLNTAMTASTQRFLSFALGERNFEKLKNIFNVSVSLHLIIGFLVVLLMEIMGYFLFNGVLNLPPERIYAAKFIYQFLLVSTFFTIISVPYDGVINAHENMLFVALLGIFEVILKLSIAIYITYNTSDKLITYGILMSIMSILLLIVRRLYCIKKYEEVKINLNKYFKKTLFKEMAGFAGWNFLYSASSIITMQGMSIVLNSFFGVVVNAAQGIVNQISGQLMTFSNMMLKALNPLIVRSEGEQNRKQMLKATVAGSKLSFFLLSFFTIPVIIELPFILNLWLKEVPDFTVIFCRLNLIVLMLRQLTVTLPTAIGAVGKIKESMLWESGIFIFLLPLSIVMYYFNFQPQIIYINLIFVVLATSITRIVFAQKYCDLNIKDFIINIIGRSILVSLITFLFTIFLTLFLPKMSFERLFVVFLTSSVLFLLIGYKFGLQNNEKEFINKFKNNIIKLNIKK